MGNDAHTEGRERGGGGHRRGCSGERPSSDLGTWGSSPISHDLPPISHGGGIASGSWAAAAPGERIGGGRECGARRRRTVRGAETGVWRPRALCAEASIGKILTVKEGRGKVGEETVRAREDTRPTREAEARSVSILRRKTSFFQTKIKENISRAKFIQYEITLSMQKKKELEF
jgi:hypothetical protein